MSTVAMRIAGESDRSIPKKQALTKTIIEGLKCPDDRRALVVYDTKVPGLCIHVTKERKCFYVYRKVQGRPIRFKLCSYPDKTIEQARDDARKQIGAMADGKDPREERRAVRKSSILGDLFKRWEAEYAKLQHTAKTLRTDKSRFDTCFDGWKGRNIATIQAQQVRALHSKIAQERGKTTANRAIQLLRRLLYWAGIEPNPAGKKCVRFFREDERERFLQPGELPKFFESLNQEPNETLRDFFYACLWTGQRRSNVASMRWDEIDMPSYTWTIPGAKTKNHKPQQVHLAPPMLELLERRKQKAAQRALKGDSRYSIGYVFPSRRTDAKAPHLTDPKAAWARLLERAGLSDLRIHDLRRSLGSWATMTGANQQIVGKALGHLDQNSTAIYARLNLDPVRASVNAALEAIQAAANGGEKKKLVGCLMDGKGVLSEPVEITIETHGEGKTWLAKLTVPMSYKGTHKKLRLVLPNGTKLDVKGDITAGKTAELSGSQPLQ